MSFPGLPDFRTVNSEEQAQIVLTMHHLNLRILRGAHISGHVSSGKSSALFLRVAAAAASPLLRSSSSNRASSTRKSRIHSSLSSSCTCNTSSSRLGPWCVFLECFRLEICLVGLLIQEVGAKASCDNQED